MKTTNVKKFEKYNSENNEEDIYELLLKHEINKDKSDDNDNDDLIYLDK